MFYEIVKIVVPFYDDGDLTIQIRYKVKVDGGSSLPITFDDESKAIDYVEHLIRKAGDR